MKQSERFNNILDECLERLLGGDTIEQCLQSYPEQADELEPLLQTALAAKKAATIQPSAEFKARARYQFHSALQEMEPKRGFRFIPWQSRWATAVAVILILVLLGSGTIATASNSMPDGTLYPVKLATEQTWLRLTTSAIDKAELHARLADERVAEIIYMASKGDSQQVKLVAQRLDTHLESIATLVATEGEEKQAMLAPATIPEEASGEAKDVSPRTLPAPQAPPATQAPEATQAPPASKRDELEVIVSRNAVNDTDRLRAALKTAPESVKPALRQAIEASVVGYEEALKSIKGRENN